MMRQLLIPICLLAGAMAAHAGDYDYLVVEETTGATTVFVSDGLTLTYSSSALSVQPASGSSSSFALTALSKMYFSSSATGISALNATAGEAPVRVYSQGGISLGEFASAAEAARRLPKGAYVMKGKERTVQMMIR